ncbi:hypothetical protein F4782DRAFT_533480 [Xylaria castorea]|nr:hypothetical protein F4782DRAFT_533480 [Xylaria castorea]
MAAQFGLADGPRTPYPLVFSSTTFRPCHMLFDGTLMDSDVLQRITRCPTKPVLRPGWITGFKLKMWGGLFPTPIPLDELSKKVQYYQQFYELQPYETSAYRGHWCQTCTDDIDSSNEEDCVLENSVVFF